MTTRSTTLLTQLALLLFGSASYAQCVPIAFAPTTISTSGAYCVTANLSSATIHAPAISVNASSVTLDFQGFRLRWTGSTSSGVAGVSIQPNKLNVTVRNGLVSGFTTGIESSAAGTIVEDMRLNNNDLGVAIRVGGEGSIIRRNSIRLGNGIQVEGSNDPSDVANTGSVRIVDNDIFGPETAQGSNGSNGIYIQSKNAFVVGNRLGRLYTGIWFDVLRQATGKYRDNLNTNVTTPYQGGTDVGNNN